MKKKIPPTYLYAPFQKIERQGDILFVEGYTFVNEIVPGEGGVRLKRSAMEAATPDYLQWGAVREMHGKNAAGVAMGVEWDERGAYIRAKVVDREAQRKVEEGVYKGFSCGVNPTLVRGKDVDACRWIENSLVDRPKDPDCLLSVSRVDDYDPEGLECLFEDAPDVAVERLEPVADPDTDGDVERAEGEGSDAPTTDAGDVSASREAVPSDDPDTTATETERGETVESNEREESTEEAGGSTSEETRGQTVETVPVRENLEGKCPHCGCQRMGRGCDSMEHALTAEAKKNERVEDLENALTRAEELTGELARVQGLLDEAERVRSEFEVELSRAKERITTLEQAPIVRAPVRFPTAATREFWANMERAGVEEKQQKQEELTRLQATELKDLNPEQKMHLAASINRLRQEIALIP